MLCDSMLGSDRTVREQFAHSLCKALDMLFVEARAKLGLALSTQHARIVVGQALRFGPNKPYLLYQNALSLVPVASSAPLEDDCGQRRVLAGATRQRGVPRGKEDEVIEVGAGQTKSTSFPGKTDPRATPERVPTFIASGLAGRNEYLQIPRFMHGRPV